MRPSIVVSCVVVLMTVPYVGHASDVDEPGMAGLSEQGVRKAPDWHHAIKLDGGFLSATGFGGINYIFAPVEMFNLEAGVGYGFSGVQISLMPKIAAGSRNDRYVGGVGLALAIPTGNSAIETPGLWLNADIAGYEHRFDCGVSLSIALGLTAGLAGGKWHGISEHSESESLLGVIFPQGRLSLAYWF